MGVTFWHETCLLIKRTNNFLIMSELTKQYEIAKNNSKKQMQNGQIGAYLSTLIEMNKYKRLMLAVVAN